MPRYRSKPAELDEANQWFTSKYFDVNTEQVKLPGVTVERKGDRFMFYVTTIHNQKVYIEDGDYVVREPDNVHYYPVKPKIFESRWELIP